MEGIPLDVFHDLRKKNDGKKEIHYPFASFDHYFPGHRSGNRHEDGSVLSTGHMDRVRRITDLLSHLSNTSRIKNILEELCLERNEFEDVLFELENQGRRDVVLCALHFCPSSIREGMSQSFYDDFMNVLIRNKCPTYHLVQIKQFFEHCQWKAAPPLLYHLAQLCITENDIDVALMFVRSSEDAVSDTVSFNRFIEASISANKVNEAFKLFHEMQKRSVPRDVHTYALLMTCCFRQYDSQAMFDFLSEMKEDNIKPDLYIYNLCIRACEQLNDLDMALILYEEMREINKIRPNTKTYSILIQLCGRNGRLMKILELLEELKASGQKMSTLTMNGLLQACTKSGDPERALSFFEEMRDENGLRPDGHTYAILFQACAAVKDLPRTLTLLRQMKRVGLRIDEVAYTSAIDVCASCGDAQTAVLLLHEMVTDNVRPNIVTRDALIRTCVCTAREPSSSILLEEVKRYGFKMDVDMYNSIMNGCASYGDLTNTVKWRKQMTEDHVAANAETYTILIKAATKCPDFMAATQFLKDFEECGLPLSIRPYNAYLVTCLRCHDYVEAQRVFTRLRFPAKGDPNAVRPNTMTYNTMIRAALNAERLDDARALFEEIEQRGLKYDNITNRLLERASM